MFKACFKFPHCVGAIGGKPKLALYFIGCIGSEVLYLDPHYVQRTGTVGKKDSEDEKQLDATYHTRQAHRSDIKDIDPSLALVRQLIFNLWIVSNFNNRKLLNRPFRPRALLYVSSPLYPRSSSSSPLFPYPSGHPAQPLSIFFYAFLSFHGKN